MYLNRTPLQGRWWKCRLLCNYNSRYAFQSKETFHWLVSHIYLRFVLPGHLVLCLASESSFNVEDTVATGSYREVLVNFNKLYLRYLCT